MYSLLIARSSYADDTALIQTARIKPTADYDMFTYNGKRPIALDFRGKEVMLERGMRFGVRKSADGKKIRLILDSDANRVFTISLDTAKQLAKNIKGT